MLRLKRVPGFVYVYRYHAVTLVLVATLLLYVVTQSRIICNNHDVEAAIHQVCSRYWSGEAMGTFCDPLCRQSTLESTLVSCSSRQRGKQHVFSVKWEQYSVIVKSAYSTSNKLNKSVGISELSEDEFRSAVEDLINKKLNMSVTTSQVERLLYLTGRPQELSYDRRQMEKDHVWTLLQSQEYLLSLLFSNKDMFPDVFGTCGELYAVEHLSHPDLESFHLFDGERVWSERMRLAILIMDLLEQLETDFPDPLYLCDIKMSHFGLTNLGRLKFLDLDVVYTYSRLHQITAGGQICREDSDCDLADCKASCNANTNRCDLGITNNNLQIVCDKVFLGWTLSGKLMVPGLLMTGSTPASLASLLRQCAENGRSAVPEDIRQRLYTTLTEMEQILSDRLS